MPVWANILSAVIFPIFLVFAVEWGHIQSLGKTMDFAFTNIGVLVFDIFLVGMVFSSFSLLFRRMWISAAICSVVFYTFSCIEFFKYNISGSHFIISDLALTKNVGDVAMFADLSFNIVLLVVALLLGLYVTALWFFKINVPLGNTVRFAAFFGVFAVMLVSLATPFFNTVCNASGVDYTPTKNTFQENARFSKNSLTANLAVNVNQLINSGPERPRDYNEDAVEAIIQGNSVAKNDLQNTAKINVITIMSESFADFRDFLSTYSDTSTVPEGTYDVFDEILAESVVGKCIVPTFGGGTVRSEFELIFGLPMEAHGNMEVPLAPFNKGKEYSSVATLYRNSGYSTAYMHPFSEAFYERIDYYGGFGFDTLMFEKEMSAYLTPELLRIEKNDGMASAGYYHNFISDASVLKDALTRIKNTDSADYIHITTMQNHMPYGDSLEEETNYFAGIKNSTEALRDFINAVKELGEPTVILYLGDHFPFFSGTDNVYTRHGINDDNCDSLYEQKYLIWNNAGLEFEEQPLISSFYLPCIIAEKVGVSDSFSEAILSQKDSCPIYSPVIATEGTEILKLLTYDRISGSNYSE